MADSDNSRTLPAVTRKQLHLSVVSSLPGFPIRPSSSSETNPSHDEPVLRLWLEWMAARRRTFEANKYQQKLEAKLFQLVGPCRRSTDAWEKADKNVGHKAALDAEEKAFEIEGALADRLWEAPASTVTGAVAKLHAIVVRGQSSLTDDEYPWPQLRIVLADLLKLDMEAIKARGSARRQTEPTRSENRAAG